MIEIRNVSKSYGSLTVLHSISLDINDGEIMAIAGPSGAGKTTLLQIASSLDRPDSGSVIFNGEDLFKMKDRKLSDFRNRNIGFIFQFHQLLAEFSALENVALPALISGTKKKKAYDEARELLVLLGLEDRVGHKPSQLSGGEKQRVAIARALINSPKVVFADEPTGSLDSHNRDEIQQIILDLNHQRNQTFVIVTHDPFIADFADRKVLMEDGRIVGDIKKSKEINAEITAEIDKEENTESLSEGGGERQEENDCQDSEPFGNVGVFG